MYGSFGKKQKIKFAALLIQLKTGNSQVPVKMTQQADAALP